MGVGDGGEVPRIRCGDLLRPDKRPRDRDIAQLAVGGEVRGYRGWIIGVERIKNLLRPGFEVGDRHGRLPFRLAARDWRLEACVAQVPYRGLKPLRGFILKLSRV